MNSNIFDTKKGDAVAYLMFYIVIPTFVTYMSFKVFPTDIISGVYCYVTILVNILNGIYDGAGRWRNGIKCRRNTKIFAIWLFDSVAGLYCLYVIFSVLILNNLDCRHDWILCAYFGTALIALWDTGISFMKDLTLKKEIGGVNT